MAHSPKILREMGRLVARAKELEIADLFASYEEMLLRALRLKATPGKNANVIQHAMGYFKKDLSRAEKHEMIEVLEQYRGGLLPLIVPVTLLSHYVRKYEPDYLLEQSYLDPHPVELKLRNHA